MGNELPTAEGCGRANCYAFTGTKTQRHFSDLFSRNCAGRFAADERVKTEVARPGEDEDGETWRCRVVRPACRRSQKEAGKFLSRVWRSEVPRAHPDRLRQAPIAYLTMPIANPRYEFRCSDACPATAETPAVAIFLTDSPSYRPQPHGEKNPVIRTCKNPVSPVHISPLGSGFPDFEPLFSCTHSSTDRTAVSGTADAGSIPAGCTKVKRAGKPIP